MQWCLDQEQVDRQTAKKQVSRWYKLQQLWGGMEGRQDFGS